jgi:hypothetical protein
VQLLHVLTHGVQAAMFGLLRCCRTQSPCVAGGEGTIVVGSNMRVPADGRHRLMRWFFMRTSWDEHGGPLDLAVPAMIQALILALCKALDVEHCWVAGLWLRPNYMWGGGGAQLAAVCGHQQNQAKPHELYCHVVPG